jgi:hypothetical protein
MTGSTSKQRKDALTIEQDVFLCSMADCTGSAPRMPRFDGRVLRDIVPDIQEHINKSFDHTCRNTIFDGPVAESLLHSLLQTTHDSPVDDLYLLCHRSRNKFRVVVLLT